MPNFQKPVLTQCVDGKSLMQFGSGNAPTLNYEMEQKSVFSSYSTHPLPIPYNKFSTQAQQLPIGTVDYTTLSADDLIRLLRNRFLKPLARQPRIRANFDTLRVADVQNLAPVAESDSKSGTTASPANAQD